MQMASVHLPAQAIQLMLEESCEFLSQLKAIWLPSYRFASDDPLLDDLSQARDRRLIPIYFDRLPTSESVSVLARSKLMLPTIHNGNDTVIYYTLRDALLRFLIQGKAEARLAILDLSKNLSSIAEVGYELQVYLLEWEDQGDNHFHPALVVPRPK